MTGVGVSQPADGQNVAAAEAVIDAFYSFDKSRLTSAMASAGESIPAIVFYQGWAEGGNYRVVNRMACKEETPGEVSCSVTVKDDLIGALGIGFNVTDTFHMSFTGGKLAKVTTSSDDPQAFHDAMAWVKKERADLIREPCQGFFAGGPTPGECVKAMVRGFAEFAARAAPAAEST